MVVEYEHNKHIILLQRERLEMNIKPSAAIRKNYNDIANFCKTSGEPVYLTKNGQGDLVVMDIVAFSRREAMLKLRENLVSAEEDRLAGKVGKTTSELDTMLKNVIAEVNNGQRRQSI
jgi:PHD/YefM family antitoxin component YafN of YafNO toxin-antitoxin module